MEKTREMMRYILTITAAFQLLLLAMLPASAQGPGMEWDMLNQAVIKLHRAGDYELAIVVARQALEVAEKDFGPNHPNVARSLNSLAELYSAQGRQKEAEPLYKRARAIDKNAGASERPDLVQSLGR